MQEYLSPRYTLGTVLRRTDIAELNQITKQ